MILPQSKLLVLVLLLFSSTPKSVTSYTTSNNNLPATSRFMSKPSSSDLYSAVTGNDNTTSNNVLTDSNEEESVHFGKFPIPPSQIFFKSPHSFGLVNIRPIVPGHVIICSNRIVPRMNELSTTEYIDLWESVRHIQDAIEKYYNVSASNVATQDGIGAGQSVPHVHVHILPRRSGDFERNDDVYDHLENWQHLTERNKSKSSSTQKLVIPEGRKDRTREEMAAEAKIYNDIMIR